MAEHYPAEAIKTDTELIGIMQFIEQLLPERAIIICQRAKFPSVQYATPNCKKIFGLEVHKIHDMLLPDFLSLVHPDDIEQVNQCFAFINDLEPYDPVRYRFTLHYRIRHQKGHFIHVTDEKIALKHRDGKYIYINSFKDVTADEKFHDVKMQIHQDVRGEFRPIQTYIPRLAQTNFTPRQKDIVNLISKGFSNNEIAQKLSVSVNTVKNHKTLLFRKVNVKNAMALLVAIDRQPSAEISR
jgi:DNA-binding CsgD family transcriptional regulator